LLRTPFPVKIQRLMAFLEIASGRCAGLFQLAVIVGTVCFALPSPASASDGFFCVGPDYFAYEFQDGGHTPQNRQGLYVVRLNGPDGFSEAVIYEFNPGTVRGMRCGEKQVQLLDDESIRSVDLDGPRTAHGVRIEREPLATGGARPEGFVLLNLGELSRARGATWPEHVPLPGTSRFRYALAVTKTAGVPQNQMYACNPAGVTYLDQFDLNRKLLRSLEIAAGCVSENSAPTPAAPQ
jgi:hypothetical protein